LLKEMRMSESAPQRPSVRLRLLQTGLATLQVAQRVVMDAQLHLRHRIAFGHKLEARPDDVFIATYPKAGTTLMQMIVHQLRGDGSMDIPHIHAVVPWLDLEILGDYLDRLAALPSPRVFKTHFLHRYLPAGARAIYIVRDVRDVYVSGYHHLCLILGRKVRPEAFARQFRHGQLYRGNWFEHLESWWPHRHDPNVLFLTYEGILADLAGTVRRVADFCGLPLDEAAMPRILERCSVEFMRRHDDKFDPRLQQIDGGIASFIRQGKAGTWREVLAEKDRERLEGEARALAARLGGGGEDPFAYLLGG